MENSIDPAPEIAESANVEQVQYSTSNWILDQVMLLKERGYSPIPASANRPIAKFKDGQQYEISDPIWYRANMIAVHLGQTVLVDVDYDRDGAPNENPDIALGKLGITDYEKDIVQCGQDRKRNFHLLFLRDREVSRQSNDGHAFDCIDVKTGNQLIYLKPHKFFPSGSLPPINCLSAAPDELLDVLIEPQKHKIEKDEEKSKFRQINDRALLRQDDWVPQIFGECAIRNDYGYRIKPKHLRPEFEEDFSIHRTGTRDWADGKGWEAIDIVRVFKFGARSKEGHEHFIKAADWLGDQIGYVEPKPQRIEEKPIFIEPEPKPLQRMNFPLTGYLANLQEHINKYALHQCEAFSGFTALSILSAAIGHTAKMPTKGGKMSEFQMAILNSGSGKDHYKTAFNHALDQAGLEYTLDAMAASAPGLHSILNKKQIGEIIRSKGLEDDGKYTAYKQALEVIAQREKYPFTVNICLDEFQNAFIEGKGSSHKEAMLSTLLELYSTNGWTRPLATKELTQYPSYSPCITFFGITTPRAIMPYINHHHVENGFIGRCTVFAPSENHQPVFNPDNLESDFENEYFDYSILNKIRGRGLGKVPFSDDGKKYYRSLTVEVYEPAKVAVGSVTNRWGEKVSRWAALIAISENFDNPLVTAKHVELSHNIISQLQDHFMAFIERNGGLGGSQVKRVIEDVKVTCIRHKEKGNPRITKSHLQRCCASFKAMDKKGMDEVVSELESVGFWEKKNIGRGDIYEFNF